MDGQAPRSGIRLIHSDSAPSKERSSLSPQGGSEGIAEFRLAAPRGSAGKPAQGGSGTELRTLLHGLFAKHGKTPHLLLNTLKEHWAGIVGPGLALRCVPHRIERGTLWVAATDACWAYEMQFHKSDILRAVGAFIESDTVRDIRFGATVAVKAGIPAAADTTGQPAIPEALHWPEPAPTAQEDAPQPAARHIADARLQAAFTRTMLGARARGKPKN